jgi:hypothetical protein
MRHLLSARRRWAASLTLIIACGVDTRAPGLLAEEEDDDELDMTPGTGGAPGGDDPTPSPDPDGGAPSDPYLNAAGANGIPSAGAGGISAGGAAGSANAGGAAGAPLDIGGAAGSAMVPIGGAGGTESTLSSSLVLTPIDGWVDGSSNAVGIQGTVSASLSEGPDGPSTLNVDSDGPAVCISGNMGPHLGSNFVNADLRIALGEPSPGERGNWSQSTPLGTFSGFTFRLTGPDVPELNFRFYIGVESGLLYCTLLSGPGTHSITAATARVGCRDGGNSLPSASPLTVLRWSVQSVNTGTTTFDFCVEDLTVVLE